jgi:hypothetical protein
MLLLLHVVASYYRVRSRKCGYASVTFITIGCMTAIAMTTI